MTTLQQIIVSSTKVSRRFVIGGVVCAIILFSAALHLFSHTPTSTSPASSISQVTLSSVASLSSNTSALPVVGTVTSLHQATILAQSSGEITGVFTTLGTTVAAGQVIAKLENSSQSAAVVQAQGAYHAAQAMLAKASGTTAENSASSASQANASAQSAAASAMIALESTYVALDDAIHAKSDALFNNPRGISPTLLPLTIPNSQLIQTLQNSRSGLEVVLSDAKSIATNASASNTDANSIAMLNDVQTIGVFVNSMIEMINQAVPNQQVGAAAISGYQASLTAARSEIIAAASTLTATKSAYDNALTGATTAANSASGGTASDISIAKASVEQALGALDAAQANLEKTIVRSPLSGTIVNLPIKTGTYVTAFSPVAIVSNAHALEIVTSVTSDDAKTLAVGSPVQVQGNASGVITSIAPAIDPTTGKVEVHIGINGTTGSLVDGQSVTINLTRTNTNSTEKSATGAPAPITIPIVALKITPAGPVVFTISASSTLMAHPVALGIILGDRTVVESGLTADMIIVNDARGLTQGQQVAVVTTSTH
jgi:RND family efflux transporter MFP subunit